MTKTRLTTKETAKALGVCVQRVSAKIKEGHFEGVERCECGRSILIPILSVLSQINHKQR